MSGKASNLNVCAPVGATSGGSGILVGNQASSNMSLCLRSEKCLR
jgi:hypothetical protein